MVTRLHPDSIDPINAFTPTNTVVRKVWLVLSAEIDQNPGIIVRSLATWLVPRKTRR